FDTGAPVTLLNNKVAKESGLFPKNFRQPLFAPFGSMGQFTISTLEVGDLKARNVSTIVMDHPTVGAIAKLLGPIEGIVGFSFFPRYKMTIDYQAKQLTFVPVNFKPPDIMQKIALALLTRDKPVKKVLAPGGQWGLRVEKKTDDE